MKKTMAFSLLLLTVCVCGCAPLIIGSAVGALGGYAISRDTIQGETDTEYGRLWNSALEVSRMRGILKSEDYSRASIKAEIESSRVWINMVRLTAATTRLKVSARKYHMPNLKLAEDLFIKIMEEAKK